MEAFACSLLSIGYEETAISVAVSSLVIILVKQLKARIHER